MHRVHVTRGVTQGVAFRAISKREPQRSISAQDPHQRRMTEPQDTVAAGERRREKRLGVLPLLARPLSAPNVRSGCTRSRRATRAVQTRFAPARRRPSACSRRSAERASRQAPQRASLRDHACLRSADRAWLRDGARRRDVDRARSRDTSSASLRDDARGASRVEFARAVERDLRDRRAALRSSHSAPACTRCRLRRRAVNFEFERATASSSGRRTTASFSLSRRARRPCSHRSPTRIDRPLRKPIALRDIPGRFEGNDHGRDHRSTYPRT